MVIYSKLTHRKIIRILHVQELFFVIYCISPYQKSFGPVGFNQKNSQTFSVETGNQTKGTVKV